VEDPAEEHEDDAEPDGYRGHRPVAPDRHRRCRSRSSDLKSRSAASSQQRSDRRSSLHGGPLLLDF
jgi:hypothetical protein